jgi:uncharacterized membrane protein HdeD (DUF308 family)
MNLNQVLPYVTTTIMFVFVVLVIARYLRHRSPHLLMWSIGLTLFAVASLAEAISTFGFNDLVFRLWYLFGAVLTAAWIGQGTVYLLLRRRWGHITLALLVLLSLVAAGFMFTMPLDPAAVSRFDPARPLSVQYQANGSAPGLIPAGVPIRGMTAIFNIYGTLVLVGGAIYSTYLFWRKRVMGNRVTGNMLIAVGALIIAAASTLARIGNGEFLYVGELLAAITMFAGFLVASRRVNDSLEREPVPTRTQPAPTA